MWRYTRRRWSDHESTRAARRFLILDLSYSQFVCTEARPWSIGCASAKKRRVTELYTLSMRDSRRRETWSVFARGLSGRRPIARIPQLEESRLSDFSSSMTSSLPAPSLATHSV
ncbi:hypothetical protein Tco_1578744 [Tanacetum coccineum]|uniref:Uncharacterized protein n=1 Tax=Tanacetum coccineum TaxID=301880 RepID=A0ABQ4Z1V6_9ASTR